MAKEITFKVRLNVDGKEQLVVATGNLSDMRKALSSIKGPAGLAEQAMQRLYLTSEGLDRMTDGLQKITDKLRSYQSELAKTAQMTGLQGKELTSLRNDAKAVADTFGEDIGEVLKASNSLAKAFGLSAEDALKLVKDGLVGGANANGEFVDTLKEYPRYFKEAGISAEEFVAITTNAAKQGVFSDKGVDAIKEGNLRIREMTTATATALDNIGISSTEVQRQLQQGSITTFQVMQQVAAKLKELPASSAAVGSAIADIFGGPGEDAGLEYLKSLADIELSMDKVREGADEYSKSLGEQADKQADVSNGISQIIDLSKIFNEIAPYLNAAAQVGMTAQGIVATITVLKSFNALSLIAAARTTAVGAASVLMTGRLKGAAAAVRVLGAALTTGAYSATAMKIAMRSLLIATGVGIAIAAVTTAIEHFTNSADEATDKTDRLSEADNTYITTAANVQAELDEETRKLSSLIKAKRDTSDAVQHLNQRYGEIFGSHKTAAEWYDILTRKSKAYAMQLGYEAQAKLIASKIAEKQMLLEENFSKRRDLWKSGGARKTTKHAVVDTQTDRVSYYDTTEDTDEYKDLKKEARGLIPEIKRLQKQLDIATGKVNSFRSQINGTSTTPHTQGTTPATITQRNTPKTKVSPKKEDTTDPRTHENYKKSLDAFNKQLEDSTKEYEHWTGVMNNPRNVDEYEEKLSELRDLQRKALSTEVYKALQTKIDETSAALNEFKGEASDTDEVEAANKRIADSYDQLGEQGRTAFDTLRSSWDTVKGIGSSIENITSALSGNAGVWQTVVSVVDGFIQLYGGIKDITGILGLFTSATASQSAAEMAKATASSTAGVAVTGTAAAESAATASAPALVATNKALAASYMQLASSIYAATYAAIPFAGPGLSAGFSAQAAATAITTAAIIAASPFANGGIVSGPTLALVGEYAGAGNNPEVIAPLDKLRSLLRPPGLAAGDIRLEVRGRKLVGVLANETRISNKSGRRSNIKI